MKTIFLAVFLLSSSLAFAGAPISFAQLPAGDTIQVTFSSSGCFHHITYEFDFRRTETMTAKVTRVEEPISATSKQPAKTTRTKLGTVNLSKDEVAGLDRLFAFYRSQPHGGCTTVDHITATRATNGTVQTTESFTDASCATYDKKNLTRLPALAAKLRPGNSQ